MKFTTEKLLHGGDYNPEQWLNMPEILDRDIELMKQAHINVVSLGIFSWSTLEPREGEYHFEWMEQIVNRLYENGISIILATPSGARPKWLADRYPEVLRVDAERRKQLFGGRHNHCYTSPVYREKVYQINRKLSERLGSHPGVILWHISNEYGGECHCPLCQDAFRSWLKERYQTIENLNDRWSTTFWSHTYGSFDEIESPSPIGETSLHALNLDWKRFVTHQTADFLEWEKKAVQDGGSSLPVTANLMYRFEGLDYFEFAKHIDVVSWDTYPTWGKEPLIRTARDNAMQHDLMRSLKDQPFFQMESCPAAPNWQGVSKVKKPGVLFAQSMQPIIHGGEGAMYFQIRQSRGASEKFHGAVIDHYGGGDTRTIREVSRAGQALEALGEVVGSRVESPAAVLYDWNSRWAMEDAQGPRNNGLHYHDTVLKVYEGFRKQGLNVDVIDMSASLDRYQILALPMVYMFKEGFAEKVRSFVENGGLLITTYWSGIVDDTDRCYLNGVPYGLMDVLGLRSEEIDALYDWEENQMLPAEGNALGLSRTYTCRNLCDLVRADGAEALMTYGTEFYAGYPVLTEHSYGKGTAWYVAADGESDFYDDLIAAVSKRFGIAGPTDGEIPEGLEVATRETDENRYIFYQNFAEQPLELPLPHSAYEVLFGDPDKALEPLGLTVLKQKK